ncbi:MAG: hypothetical protein LUI09_03710 [Prevotellaceae bacterium]|nr:hypothetical protein [Prevotellaceae bacterium]
MDNFEIIRQEAEELLVGKRLEWRCTTTGSDCFFWKTIAGIAHVPERERYTEHYEVRFSNGSRAFFDERDIVELMHKGGMRRKGVYEGDQIRYLITDDGEDE